MRTLYAFTIGSAIAISTHFLSCSNSQKDNVAGGFSDETETTELTGMLVDSEGTPQANARVLLRQDFRSASADVPIASLKTLEAFTNQDGKYHFDSISAGKWNLDARNNSLGSLRKVTCDSKALTLSPDTLKLMVSTTYRTVDPNMQAIFLPQTNQTLPLVGGEALITMPVGTIEIIPLATLEEKPLPSSSPELLEIKPASLPWNQVFRLEFLSEDPWSDGGDGSTHMQNVSAPPSVSGQGAARFNGNTCFKILNDRDYSFSQFQFSTRVLFDENIAGTQTLACTPNATNESSWCLRKQGIDSLVFWYSTNTIPSDSIVLTSVATSGWVTAKVSVTNDQIQLAVANQDSVAQKVSIDLSNNTSPIFLGCTVEDSDSIEYLNADIDWFALDKL